MNESGETPKDDDVIASSQTLMRQFRERGGNDATVPLEFVKVQMAKAPRTKATLRVLATVKPREKKTP